MYRQAVTPLPGLFCHVNTSAVDTAKYDGTSDPKTLTFKICNGKELVLGTQYALSFNVTNGAYQVQQPPDFSIEISGMTVIAKKNIQKASGKLLDVPNGINALMVAPPFTKDTAYCLISLPPNQYGANCMVEVKAQTGVQFATLTIEVEHADFVQSVNSYDQDSIVIPGAEWTYISFDASTKRPSATGTCGVYSQLGEARDIDFKKGGYSDNRVSVYATFYAFDGWENSKCDHDGTMSWASLKVTLKYLPIPTFKVRNIGQNQLLAGLTNTITVTVNIAYTSAAFFQHPAVIILSGLNGASTTLSTVALTSPQDQAGADLFCLGGVAGTEKVAKATMLDGSSSSRKCRQINDYEYFSADSSWIICANNYPSYYGRVPPVEVCSCNTAIAYVTKHPYDPNSRAELLAFVEDFEGGRLMCTDQTFASYGVEKRGTGEFDYRYCLCRKVDNCDDFPALQLELCPEKVMEGGSNYVFSFQIENPAEPQNSPLLYVEAFESLQAFEAPARISSAPKAVMIKPSHPTLGLTDALSLARFRDPLFVAKRDILKKTIAQSSPYVSSSNNLTVTLQTSMDVPGMSDGNASVFSITGLQGATLHDGNVPLLSVTGGNGGNTLFCSNSTAGATKGVGVWSQSAATLTLIVCWDTTLKSGVVLSFAFQVINGPYVSAGPAISIELGGSVSVRTSSKEMEAPPNAESQKVSGIKNGAKALFLNAPMISSQVVECIGQSDLPFTQEHSCTARVPLPTGVSSPRLTVLLEHASVIGGSSGDSNYMYFTSWINTVQVRGGNTGGGKNFYPPNDFGYISPNHGQCGQYMEMLKSVDVLDSWITRSIDESGDSVTPQSSLSTRTFPSASPINDDFHPASVDVCCGIQLCDRRPMRCGTQIQSSLPLGQIACCPLHCFVVDWLSSDRAMIPFLFRRANKVSMCILPPFIHTT